MGCTGKRKIKFVKIFLFFFSAFLAREKIRFFSNEPITKCKNKRLSKALELARDLEADENRKGSLLQERNNKCKKKALCTKKIKKEKIGFSENLHMKKANITKPNFNKNRPFFTKIQTNLCKNKPNLIKNKQETANLTKIQPNLPNNRANITENPPNTSNPISFTENSLENNPDLTKKPRKQRKTPLKNPEISIFSDQNTNEDSLKLEQVDDLNMVFSQLSESLKIEFFSLESMDEKAAFFAEKLLFYRPEAEKSPESLQKWHVLNNEIQAFFYKNFIKIISQEIKDCEKGSADEFKNFRKKVIIKMANLLQAKYLFSKEKSQEVSFKVVAKLEKLTENQFKTASIGLLNALDAKNQEIKQLFKHFI